MSIIDYEDLLDKKGDNIIDSRDLIAALDSYDEVVSDDETYTAEEREEIRAEYEELAEEVRSMEDCSADWHHGATLIHEDYFEEYAQQLAEDISAISGDETWPANCIDWERAARELQTDYTSVEFGGTTYWVR